MRALPIARSAQEQARRRGPGKLPPVLSALSRFVQAQARPQDGYARALAELGAGRKRGHWIWYVFPQLRGLGRSAMAQQYALADVAEASEYARDDLLGGRLREIAETAAAQLRRGVKLATLMGSDIDATKLLSCMTLFETVAQRLYIAEGAERHRALAAVAKEVLAAAAAEGHPRCAQTEAQLRAVPHE
jgi:uncharacterized protein (DUF1810 family)